MNYFIIIAVVSMIIICIYISSKKSNNILITAEAITVTYVTEKLSRESNHHEDLVYVGFITGFMRHLPAIDLPPIKNDIFKQFLSQDLNRDYRDYTWNHWAKKLKY